MKVHNVVPPLPSGVMIGQKPVDIEIGYIRNADRWLPIIESLKVIDSTKTIQINVSDMTKGKVQGMKQSIIKFAVRVNFKPKLKFAVKDGILHIWSNR